MVEFEWGQTYAFASQPAQRIAAGSPPRLTDLHDLERHPLLAPAVSKLRHAGRHLAALENNITEIAANPANRAVIRADLNPESGYHVFSVSEVPDLSEFAENIFHSVGDFAKNAHPALDKLAWQLACSESTTGEPRDPTGVNFPIVDEPNDLSKRHAERTRKQLRADHWEFIKSFQPYHGIDGRADSWVGDYVHPLALLRDLTNDEKHRISWPVFVVPGQLDFIEFEIAARDPADTVGRPATYLAAMVERLDGTQPPSTEFNDWYVFGVGEELKVGLKVLEARLAGSPEPEIDPAGAAFPQVVLGDGTHLVFSLQRVHRFVHLVLSEFGRQFPIV